ncbi:MAG: hypothetical protein FJY98_02090 [Candidatus Liptonbacteria bacterium]|nr:hypothetical protein [Candidatus Liptonbacteria bacterium]
MNATIESVSANPPAIKSPKPTHIPEHNFLARVLDISDGTLQIPRVSPTREVQTGEKVMGILGEGTGQRLFDWREHCRAQEQSAAKRWLPDVPAARVIAFDLGDEEVALLGEDGDYAKFWAEMKRLTRQRVLAELHFTNMLHECFPGAEQEGFSRLEPCVGWRIVALL